MANGATYVSPRPAIKLKGAANDDMVDSLLDIAVRAPEAGMASAEIRMVNWGTQPSAPVNFLFNTVAIGDKIEIAFGLAQQKTVFKGEVTAIEERYGDGVPQIVLLAEDALHRLARHRASRAFQQTSPNSIVQTLASDAGLQADAKLSDTPGDYIQLNESDLHFLRRLAARYGATPRVADVHVDLQEARGASRARHPRRWRHAEASPRHRRTDAPAPPGHRQRPGPDRGNADHSRGGDLDGPGVRPDRGLAAARTGLGRQRDLRRSRAGHPSRRRPITPALPSTCRPVVSCTAISSAGETLT